MKRRIRIALHRSLRNVRAAVPDALVLGGVALLAYAAGQAPDWIGAVAGPAVLGAGLIWIVRGGSDADPRRAR